MSLKFPMDGPLSLDDQRQLFTEWLTGVDARQCARRLVDRYRLVVEPDDVLSECWARLSGALRRRGEPYPGIVDAKTATRFAYRSLDNLCRDLARTSRRRGVSVALRDDQLEPLGVDQYGPVEQRMMLEQLLVVIGRIVSQSRHCTGCPSEVAAAAALEAVHLMIRGDIGEEAGRAWLDRILYQALENVDGSNTRTPEARRQRKSRCGRCASEILAEGLITLGVEP